LSERTVEAAHRIGQALEALDEIKSGEGSWYEFGLIMGHLLHAVNDLIVAIEELER
jgi:hypothetical protein